jgi:hypothetical protein
MNKPRITANPAINVPRLFHFHVRDKLADLVRGLPLARAIRCFFLRARQGNVSSLFPRKPDRVNLIPATGGAIDAYAFKLRLQDVRNLTVDKNAPGLGPNALAAVQDHVRQKLGPQLVLNEFQFRPVSFAVPARRHIRVSLLL